MRDKGKKFVQKIALERINRLFELAEAEFEEHPERSKRYVELIKKIGSRNKVSVPWEFKGKFCKKCNVFLKGKNVELEEEGELLRITCKECGNVRKIGLEGKKK